MDSDESADHEPMDSPCGRSKRPLSPQASPPPKRRRSKSPRPSTTDVSMQSNTIVAGRDATFNIGVADVPQRNPPLDTRALANWLSPLNHHAIHKDICEKVTQGTGSWMFEHPKFVDWLAKKATVLWGTGIPGAGKTCLTTIVIKHLIQYKRSTVIYFYCRYNDQLTTAEILACMLKQMVEASKEVAQYVSNSLHKECLRTETKPSKSELLATLLGATQISNDLFLAVDALDELRDDVRPELISNLLSLQQPLFLTSRPLFDVPDMKGLRFTIRAPDQDLFIHISTRIAAFPKLEPLLRKPEVRKEIIAKIQARCNGMFLLAALQVDAVVSAGVVDVKGLREAVEHLPTTLKARYELTMARIKAQKVRERDLAFRLLVFITHATRTLRVNELLDALAVNAQTASFEEESRTAEETLIGVCMGLVTIGNRTRTVRLVHYTTQDFLRSWHGTGIFSDPHMFIAETSAIYIFHADFDDEDDDDNDCDSYYSEEPDYTSFFDYARSNLGYHTYRANATGRCPTHVYQLLRNRPHIMLRLAHPDYGWLIDRGQAIHFAALYGLETLLEEQCEELNQKELNARTDNGHTLLHLAAGHGYGSIVHILLNVPGIEINTMDDNEQTPLHYAAENGHASVVQLLLKAPWIEINTKDDNERTPLHYAAKNGHASVVQSLVNVPGIEINPKDDYEQTPLHYAAENGHASVVQLLVNVPGIEINPKDNYKQTPLHDAAGNGHYSVVVLLLGSPNIDVNAQIEDGRTPLHNAVQNEHPLVVQMLLNSPGIEVNPRTNDRYTPLHFAAETGHEPAAQLLLKSPDIEVNPKTEFGETPLHLSAENGHKSLVQLLLNSPGIEVNPKTEDGWTPLHYAVTNYNISVFQLLLKLPGIDVNPETNKGWTPLHYAVRNQRESFVQALLSYPGIAINSKTEDGCVPLHFAACNGTEAVVQLLLNSPSVDINPKTKDGSTPLHYASENGHESIVHILLNSPGIDANAREDGWTPLHYAALNGHKEVVRRLLSFHGIDAYVESQCPLQMTPLDVARLEHQYQIVAVFEEMGLGKAQI